MFDYAKAKTKEEIGSAVCALDMLQDIQSDMRGLFWSLSQAAFFVENGGIVEAEALFLFAGNAVTMSDAMEEALQVINERISQK